MQISLYVCASFLGSPFHSLGPLLEHRSTKIFPLHLGFFNLASAGDSSCLYEGQ